MEHSVIRKEWDFRGTEERTRMETYRIVSYVFKADTTDRGAFGPEIFPEETVFKTDALEDLRASV